MKNIQKIDFRRERSLGDKLHITFAFIRQNFTLLAKSIVFIIAPFAAIGAVVVALYLVTKSTLAQSNYLDVQESETIVLLFVGVVAYFILVATAMSSVIYAYFQLYQQLPLNSFTIKDVFERAKHIFWNVTFTTLAIMAIIGIVVLLIFVGFINTKIGFLIFLGVLVIMYLSIALSMALSISVMEKTGIATAIVRSFQLITNNWWETVVLLFLTLIIQGMLSMIFQLPVLIYTATLPYLTLKNPDDLNTDIIYIILLAFYSIGVQLLQVIISIMLIVQYFHLVEKREAVGLLERIELVGQQVEEQED